MIVSRSIDGVANGSFLQLSSTPPYICTTSSLFNHLLKDTDNTMVVTEGERESAEVEESKGGQIFGDRKRLDFGW